MKLVYFTDSHIRGTTPRSREDDYVKTLWSKFMQLTAFIKDEKIEAILNGGDLFDTPDPSTGLVNKYLQLFKSWKLPVYSIIGSHDKFGYNDQTVTRTALGTLIASDVVRLIDKPVELTKNVWISGVSHSYDLDEFPVVDYFKKKPDNGYMIQLCHGMITDIPFFGKHTLYSQIQTEADLVLCGHYHAGFGPFTVNNSIILNIGSMGRTEKTPRLQSPGFLYIDTDLKTFKFIRFNVASDPFISNAPTVPEVIDDIQTFIKMLKGKIVNFEQTDLKQLIVAAGKENNISTGIIEKALGYIEYDE